MNLLNTLSFILKHPLNLNHKWAALRRYFYWQIGSRLLPGAVAVPFVNDSRLLVCPGMTGATGFDINAIKIYLDEVCIVENGGVAETYTEQQGQEVMNKTDIKITVLLGRGEYQDTVYTSDLSYDYVKINAEYRT